jgi:hypothetical protein
MNLTVAKETRDLDGYFAPHIYPRGQHAHEAAAELVRASEGRLDVVPFEDKARQEAVGRVCKATRNQSSREREANQLQCDPSVYPRCRVANSHPPGPDKFGLHRFSAATTPIIERFFR